MTSVVVVTDTFQELCSLFYTVTLALGSHGLARDSISQYPLHLDRLCDQFSLRNSKRNDVSLLGKALIQGVTLSISFPFYWKEHCKAWRMVQSRKGRSLGPLNHHLEQGHPSLLHG